MTVHTIHGMTLDGQKKTTHLAVEASGTVTMLKVKKAMRSAENGITTARAPPLHTSAHTRAEARARPRARARASGKDMVLHHQDVVLHLVMLGRITSMKARARARSKATTNGQGHMSRPEHIRKDIRLRMVIGVRRVTLIGHHLLQIRTLTRQTKKLRRKSAPKTQWPMPHAS